MVEYNVNGGKANRAKALINCAQTLCPQANSREISLMALCVELLQASFLVADDIMDDSQLRRGKPCWFRQVGLKAINDAFILLSLSRRVLHQACAQHPNYIKMVELLEDVTLRTELGQLMDLGCGEEEVDFMKYHHEQYHRIIRWKTAYYSFVLPIRLAMLYAGVDDNVEPVLLPLGEYFQIQDDYLDCFGSVEVMGKQGRDIEEGKCCWPLVTSLGLASASQLQIIQACYGKEDPACVQAIKNVYMERDLPSIYSKLTEQFKLEFETSLGTLQNSVLRSVIRDLGHSILYRNK